MVKTLEAGKLIVGAVAVCVDPTGTAATTLGIDTALQAKNWLTKDTDLAKLAAELNKAFTNALKDRRYDKPENARVLLPQMLEHAALSATGIAECGLDPGIVLANMIASIQSATSASEYGPLEEDFKDLVGPLLVATCDDPRLEKALRPHLTRAQLKDGREQKALLQGLKEDTAKLVQAEESHAIQLGIERGMLISIAERYTEGETTDFESARRNIVAALETAAEDRKRGKLPSNIEKAVQHVIDTVDRLNAERKSEEARRALADAVACRRERIAREEAGMSRILDKTIVQARIDNMPELATQAEIEKLPLDTPDPAAQFDALRAVQNVWYERGRDMGLNFDLEVSIALARATSERAKNADERGTAGNDLGLALATLGEREPGTETLEEAVQAYREALKENTRERAPLDWAMTQMNLGTALATLGTREPGTETLEEAVKAYREALKERARDRVPLDWAMTQMNLGIALRNLGERETGTEKLEEAVKAYREALKEYTRERVPLHWANTLGNQGITLMLLGERKGDADIARQALDQLTEAESVLRDGGHFAWAKAFENAIPEAQALVETLTSDTKA